MEAPTPAHGGGGAGNVAAFGKKHMMFLAIAAGSLVLLLLWMRRNSSSSSGSMIQYPDATTGLPLGSSSQGAQPAASTNSANTGDSGVGGTIDPSQLFSSFLQGFAFGQTSNVQQNTGPTDSSGISNPVDTSASSTFIPISPAGTGSHAAPNPSSHPGINKTKSIPPVHKQSVASVNKKPTSISAHPKGAIQDVGSARHSQPARSGALSKSPQGKPGANNVPIKKSVEPTHSSQTLHLPTFPSVFGKATGTHIGTASTPTKSNKPAAQIGKTPIKTVGTAKIAPPPKTLPQIDKVSMTAAPRQTTVAKSTDVASKALSNAVHRASGILTPVLTQPNKVPAAPAPKPVKPPVAAKSSPVASSKAKPTPTKPKSGGKGPRPI